MIKIELTKQAETDYKSLEAVKFSIDYKSKNFILHGIDSKHYNNIPIQTQYNYIRGYIFKKLKIVFIRDYSFDSEENFNKLYDISIYLKHTDLLQDYNFILGCGDLKTSYTYKNKTRQYIESYINVF